MAKTSQTPPPLRPPPNKKSASPAHTTPLIWAEKHAEWAAELSITLHLCCQGTMINAADLEFKRPKDLACLVEISPGEAAIGTRGRESCSGGTPLQRPRRWAAPSMPLNRGWWIVWHQWSCRAAGACHCPQEGKKWAQHSLDVRGKAGGGVQPCSDQ